MEWRAAMTRLESTTTTYSNPSTSTWLSTWTTCTIRPTSRSCSSTSAPFWSQNLSLQRRLICVATWCSSFLMLKHSATSRIWKSIVQLCACKPLSSTERVKEESFPQLRKRSERLSAGVGGAWHFGMSDSEELPNIASIIQTCSKLRGLLAHAAKSEIQLQRSKIPISP